MLYLLLPKSFTMLLKVLKGNSSYEMWEQWVLFQLLLAGPEYLFTPVNLWVSVEATLLKNPNPLGQFWSYRSLPLYEAFSFYSAPQERLFQDPHQVLELELKLDWMEIDFSFTYGHWRSLQVVTVLSSANVHSPKRSKHRAKGQISAPSCPKPN